jgi:hypothetical protein
MNYPHPASPTHYAHFHNARTETPPGHLDAHTGAVSSAHAIR